jgi:hypothetical protein
MSIRLQATLTQFEREIARFLQRVRSLEEISVPDAAKKLKKSPSWVRANFPVIYYGPKSHRIRLVDIEEYRSQRTVWPKNGRESARDNDR